MSSGSEKLIRHRDTCRLCESKSVELVFKLAPTPLANSFVPASELAKKQPEFPLDVYFCRDCAHVQLLDIVDPRVLFENYLYVSGTSPVLVEHFRKYAEDASKRMRLSSGDLVVEIASNDGTLLRFFKQAGIRILGVDPAKNIAKIANESGVETIAAFFTRDLSRDIKAKHGPAKVITANNVFAHADDLKGMVLGIRDLLTPDGVFIFEVSYLVDVYSKTLFDTIYHEHLSYHSVKPLRDFFARNGMELIEAERVAAQGGSLRGIAQIAGAGRPVGPSVKNLIELEAELGLHRAETLRHLSEKIDRVKVELNRLLRDLKAKGKHVAGYGAPAKTTTLMYHFGLGRDVLDFIVDDSPLKQGRYSPGSHIPILPATAIYERKPDYLLVLAWNFAESIMAKHKAYNDAGGHFIVPLPEILVR